MKMDVNGGRRIKYDFIFLEKSSDPYQKLVGKRLEIFENSKNVSLLFYRRFSANRKQFNWYLKLFICQFRIQKDNC